MSLRLKTILGIALIEAILLITLVTITLNYLRTTNYDALIKRATTTATLFATTTKDAVLSYDLASLDAFVTEIMKNPDLVYARVLGPDQALFASAGDPEALQRRFRADKTVADVTDNVFDLFANIEESGVVYGRVELGISTDKLTATIREAQKRSALIALSEMALVALFSFVLGTYLTRQLRVLTSSAERISAGELKLEIPVLSNDEVADVARAFNQMTKSLEAVSKHRDQYEKKLQELNATLEERVIHRTRQLLDKNSELEQANIAIKEAQTKLLQSEKMASLGVLAAGVAHEINNPIGFIISNISTLEEYVTDYHNLIDQYQNFVYQNIDEPAKLAQFKDYADTIDLPFIQQDLPSLVADTKEGSTRVKEIVQGLKTFSHVDESQSFELTDLNECIEATLRIAANELKYHCEIVKNLQDIPQTYCLAGQVKQVLLNLIVNAGQAITEQGTITIGSSLVDDNIEISIADNGSGISQDNLKKLFEPFFTTKPVGKGTGLGLSISYGIIVDDHQGDIRVDSRVGEGSCFTVVLPVRSEPPARALDHLPSQ